ncbi:MAG: secondary thiamine-phosphate synthase enzyme YjbQ [Syntrophorhabdaceae bacterium]|nr:secondary thiamine-phosphate synthase enzyme YjbQ [Syntrophorhabdaceae bacterium]
MVEIRIKTTKRVEAINITQEVIGRIKGTTGRLLHIYTPHTTCGIAINEDADPDVMRDILEGLERIAPKNFPYRHIEGNADAHIKSVVTGCSVTIPMLNGAPQLGTWQGIFLMEFDGPRERRVIATVL